ncbi:MAG TPA: NAD-dependent malic enzyme, partial [Actinoplanes sp.]|nr:NAD-dependent malic enzyme [Actinoplanes sp.]
MVTTRLPSAGFSITIRIAVTADASSIGRLTTCVGEAGAIVTALDVVDSDPTRVLVDLTCDTADSSHADQVVKQLEEQDGVDVRKVSDRTFLLHLGGKIEVHSKVALRNRDELSRAYTPGVARVCMAIAENPADARRLTIKRNTVAVVSDGSAVLGLGNIGPA